MVKSKKTKKNPESDKNEKIGYFAKDVMVSPVFLEKEDETEHALEKLRKERINGCIVIDEKGRFFGEVSDEDIIKLFLHQVKSEPLVKLFNIGYRREFLYSKAKDIVNKHKHSVRLDTPINKVIELVSRKGFSYLPVVDNEKRVQGVVTPSSVINFLRDK